MVVAGAPMITAHPSTSALTSVRGTLRGRRFVSSCTGSTDISDYTDITLEQTQLLTTPRIAFAAVVLGAWVGSSIPMINMTLEANDYGALVRTMQDSGI